MHISHTQSHTETERENLMKEASEGVKTVFITKHWTSVLVFNDLTPEQRSAKGSEGK